MADISFYKYLEAAFRYKLFNPEGQRATFNTHFNYLGYNLNYKQLFFYARKILPKFYTSEFPDTEEGNLQMAKKVLEKLDKHQDTQLENQFKLITVSDENAQIIAEAQAQSQQAEAQQAPPAGTSAGTSFGLPGLPSVPSISSTGRMPRVIHNIPQTPEPSKPEISIANSGGVVREAGDPSKLVKTTRSGAIIEPGKPSELVTTDSGGRIVGGQGAEAPTKQIFIANKNAVVTGVRNIKSPSWLKTFGSNAQIFAKKNLGRIAGGLTDMAKGVGRGIAGPGLTGTYNLLGKAANGGLNAFERLSNSGLRGVSRSFVSSGSKKVWLWAIAGFFLIMIGVSAFSATLPGEAAPVVPPGQIIPVGEGGERIASAAKQLAAQLQFCTGGTFGPSYHCWDQMGIYDQAGDPGYLQCTEFVWAAFDEADFLNEINLIRNNNAADWPKAAQNYPQIFSVFYDARQLLPGDTISLGGKPVGQDSGVNSHLAIVIEKGENVVRVAQSATDFPVESWDINTTTGELNPLKEAHPRTRMYVQGFIRLISKL